MSDWGGGLEPMYCCTTCEVTGRGSECWCCGKPVLASGSALIELDNVVRAEPAQTYTEAMMNAWQANMLEHLVPGAALAQQLELDLG